MRKSKGTTFNCFSPPVMLATLTIEFTLALYTMWRYKLSVANRLIIGLLVFLAIFQMSEYFVCTGYGLRAEQWSRLGFVAISTLPPLGLHLLHVLANKPKRRTIAASYVSLAGFIVFFLTYRMAFIGSKCTGNYVIFQLGRTSTLIYTIYYFGWLLVAIVLGTRWAYEFKAQGKQALTQREVTQGLVAGYLVFTVPVAIITAFRPNALHGIPSIMCGFAIILALILGLYILPRIGEQRERLLPARHKKSAKNND